MLDKTSIEKPDETEILIKCLEWEIEHWTVEVDSELFFQLAYDFLPDNWDMISFVFEEEGVYFGYCHSFDDLHSTPFVLIFRDIPLPSWAIYLWDDLPQEYDCFKGEILHNLTFCTVVAEDMLLPVEINTTVQ